MADLFESIKRDGGREIELMGMRVAVPDTVPPGTIAVVKPGRGIIIRDVSGALHLRFIDKPEVALVTNVEDKG